MNRLFIAVAGVLLTFASTAPTLVQAQAYPSKPIRVVTPGPGGLDIIVRKFMATMEPLLGQKIFVENKPSGVIPGQTVALSPPDGYTLLFSGGPQWLAPLTQ